VKDLSVRRSTTASGKFAAVRQLNIGIVTSCFRGTTLLAAVFLATALSAQTETSAEPSADEAPPKPAADQPAPIPSTPEDHKGPKLPPGYRAPAKPSPAMLVDKELMTTEQEAAEIKALRSAKYATILRAGKLDANAQKILPRWAKWWMYRLTIKENRRTLNKLRQTFLREVTGTAGLQDNPVVARSFREAMLKQVTKHAAELLDNHLTARVQAVLILSQLNLDEERRKYKTTRKAYTEAYLPLLSVIDDKAQDVGVKILAANGLKRIALIGDPSNDVKNQIATSLVRELDNSDAYFWYQWSLAVSMAAIDLPLDRAARQPIICNALMKAMVEKKRHWIVRCRAAKSLGRAALDPQINVELMTFEIAQLAQDMAKEYNQKPNQVHWKKCYFDLYLAFQPLNEFEKKRGFGLLQRVERPGFSKHRSKTTEAYEHILPFVTHLLWKSPNKLPNSILTPMADWLAKNKPQNNRLAPNLQPVSATQASDAAGTILSGESISSNAVTP